MGKEDKEDSGYGFKDKAKAEETLRLLEREEAGYRRLTVRGLLGRAKRVLSLTKAEDKIKNIKEAMEVFETWISEQDGGSGKKEDSKKKGEEKETKDDKKKEQSPDVEMADKSDKKEKELPSESVPGLGFKDPESVEATLKLLKGRDPEYQKLAVKGLIRNAKRVLTCTKDESKKTNIKEAISTFEKFLDDYDTQHLDKQNNPYLPLGVVKSCLKLAGGHVTEEQKSFIVAYESVRGEYKRLRTVPGDDDDTTWDILRNKALKEIKEKYAEAKLFNEKDEPTKEHLEMLLWAYSPEATKVKKNIPETEQNGGEKENRKRKSGAEEDESPNKKKKDE